MKILIFSDIHGDLRALERVVAQPADIYIAAGDLSNFGKGLENCGKILQPLGARLFVLPGNHETHQQTKAFCQQHGFVDFHRQTRQVAGTNWAGLGYSNITPFKTPGEYSEAEIAAALGQFAGLEKLYLVVHFPPLDTKLDEYAAGQHAGSPTLREWVEREKPLYLFCGHIHETAGISDRLGTTQCINVGKQGYTMEM
ncbi:MAG: metallophosphoesterase [Candidatus Acidiferrales bacterium]